MAQDESVGVELRRLVPTTPRSSVGGRDWQRPELRLVVDEKLAEKGFRLGEQFPNVLGAVANACGRDYHSLKKDGARKFIRDVNPNDPTAERNGKMQQFERLGWGGSNDAGSVIAYLCESIGRPVLLLESDARSLSPTRGLASMTRSFAWFRSWVGSPFTSRSLSCWRWSLHGSSEGQPVAVVKVSNQWYPVVRNAGAEGDAQVGASAALSSSDVNERRYFERFDELPHGLTQGGLASLADEEVIQLSDGSKLRVMKHVEGQYSDDEVHLIHMSDTHVREVIVPDTRRSLDTSEANKLVSATENIQSQQMKKIEHDAELAHLVSGTGSSNSAPCDIPMLLAVGVEGAGKSTLADLIVNRTCTFPDGSEFWQSDWYNADRADEGDSVAYWPA